MTNSGLARLFEEEEIELLGVADATPQDIELNEREYDEWIGSGYHGEMEYLRRHAHAKFRPDRVMPGCRSVIAAGMNYYQESPPASSAPPRGRIARYAWGRDYHLAFGKRLKRIVRRLRDANPDHEFRSFVDASPLSERFFAFNAGIGFTGRNTLAISNTYGSYFFIGEILTTKQFVSNQEHPAAQGACPSGCFRCGSACPTNALFAPYRIDASRCISYLTIEHRGSVEVNLRSLMGDWIFGCDLCQEACPLNAGARVTETRDFTVMRAGSSLELGAVIATPDDDAFRSRFAGSPLMRPGRIGVIRNALIAAANTGARDLLPLISEKTRDESPIIREHAQWAQGVLVGPH